MADDHDPAERAFEQLRAEVTIMRRTLEELCAVVEEDQPPDYSTTLGAIAKGNAAIAQHIEQLHRHVKAHLPPELFAREMAAAAEHGLQPARRMLEEAQAALRHGADVLQAVHARARTKAEQREQLRWVAAVGVGSALLVLVLLVLPLARALPASWAVPDRLAAAAIGADRWSAGQQMMANASPATWKAIGEAVRLHAAGGKSLRDCLARAEKSGAPERCTVTLTPLA